MGRSWSRIYQGLAFGKEFKSRRLRKFQTPSSLTGQHKSQSILIMDILIIKSNCKEFGSSNSTQVDLNQLLRHQSLQSAQLKVATSSKSKWLPQFYSKVCNFCTKGRTLCISALFF